MNIEFFRGHIPGRSRGVAIRFEYNRLTVEDIKAAINQFRRRFQIETGQPSTMAGGWVPELKIWYVSQQIWSAVQDELERKGYFFAEVEMPEDFFGNGRSYTRDEQKYYQSPPQTAQHCQVDEFSLLGLRPGATPMEIRAAYKEIVSIVHPDKFAGNPRLQARATELMKVINKVYERLRLAA